MISLNNDDILIQRLLFSPRCRKLLLNLCVPLSSLSERSTFVCTDRRKWVVNPGLTPHSGSWCLFWSLSGVWGWAGRWSSPRQRKWADPWAEPGPWGRTMPSVGGTQWHSWHAALLGCCISCTSEMGLCWSQSAGAECGRAARKHCSGKQ